MKIFLKICSYSFILIFSATIAFAISPLASEIKAARNFVQSAIERTNPNLPFSFVYGGKRSGELLPTWKVQRQTHKLGSRRTERIISYTDPKTGLVVRCVAVQYSDFPVVEWTLYFKNTGRQDTPIITNIQALDIVLNHGRGGHFLLHHAKGSQDRVDDFEPLMTPLPPKSSLTIAPHGGRPSNGAMPYFNVQWPKAGVILAVGWPGQWETRFNCNATNALRICAGQQLTHFTLRPGEEVRSPLIALLFYKGGWIESQNLWRRWMMAYIVPRLDGKPLKPEMFGCSSWQFDQMDHANQQNQELFIRRYLQEGLKINYWWMDAGWYPNNGSWANVGTWEVDTNRFPHGLRAVANYAHARGVEILLWFEPEQVTPHTWLYDQHPGWLLKPPPNPGGQAYQMNWRLLNLGDPIARHWLINHVSHLIKSQGINIYRQDCNIDPLYFWRSHDAPNREGITEIKYVEGYLAYWDALKRRDPSLLFDSCASGGRRLDLCTMRRSVPRTRSDCVFNQLAQQCQTYGLSLWLPYYGTGFIDPITNEKETYKYFGPISTNTDYVFYSDMCPSMTWCCDVRRKDLHYSVLRKLLSQWRKLAPDMLGDYYPLTPYSTSKSDWIAWQFNRPGRGVGMVEAFRRSKCIYEAAHLKLNGLEPDAKYAVRNLNHSGTKTYSGGQLMRTGLTVSIPDEPGAAIITYKKIN